MVLSGFNRYTGAVEVQQGILSIQNDNALGTTDAGTMVDNGAVLEIQGIARRLASTGIGVLVTDHNVRETLSIVDRAYIINAGEILRAGTPLALSSDAVVKKIYLGEAFQLN